MILEQLSMRIATKIKTIDPEGEEPLEVLDYVLKIRLNYVATFLLTAILGWFTGSILYSLISCVSFIIIRKVSGGLHMQSITSCAIMSSLIFSMIPQIEVNGLMVYILTAISSIIYLLYAPNFMTDSVPSSNPKLLRIKAVTLCMLNFLICSPIIALTFLVQAILILPYWKGVDTNELETKDRT